jgi:multiple sugar transport system permease protein
MTLSTSQAVVPEAAALKLGPAPAGRRRPGGRTGSSAGRVVVYLLLLVGTAFALVPFLWLIRSSLMDQVQIFTSPPQWLPDPVVWANYPDALASAPFARYLLNTLNIIFMVVPGTLLSCSAAAFAFSRLQWRGRNLFFGLLMTGMMLPYAVTLIPTFIAWQKLGFVDTYVPLTIPAFFAAGGAFNIFMLRQFFLSIPNDLDNAVYIDGGNPWTVYWRVVLPLNKGPLTLVGVFTIIAAWNDLLNPLIYLSDPNKATLSLGLAQFRGLYNSQWGLLMAASVMVIAPLIVLFFFAQRQIMEGIALTGVKG